MTILSISGSTSATSANTRLLKSIAQHFVEVNFILSPVLSVLPVFIPDNDHFPYADEVTKWRNLVRNSNAVIISTPAYLKNIPAALKNALEWLSSSGELQGKPTLAITYTPHPPRGSEAMQSLLWTLEALEARIVAQCPLYQSEVIVNKDGKLSGQESLELIEEAIKLLI